MTTPVFTCGFECGVSGSHFTLVGGSFTTSSPITGERSYLSNPSAGEALAYASQGGVGMFVFRFKVNFTTLPNADVSVCNIGNRGGAYFKTSDSKIYAGACPTGAAPIVFGTTGVAVTTGVTYYIDVRSDTTANPWLVDVQVNGTACSQFSSATAAVTTAQFIRIGFETNSSTASALFDDVILSYTSADYPIGDGQVLSYVPASDGTHTSTGTNIVKGTTGTPVGAAITSATTDAFNWVDARPIGGGATNATRLINQQTLLTTQYAEVAIEQTATDAPRAVEVLVVDRQAATTVGGFSTKLNDNGTEDVIITRSAAGVTTDRYVTKQYATMVGGGAWTLARFKGLKIRFGYSGDATPDQYWRGAMIEAEFAPLLVSQWQPRTEQPYKDLIRVVPY